MLKLRELRLEKGKTQAELALLLGTSRQVYANYENEINEPSLDMLARLADVFECSVDYLLGREDDLGNVHVNASAPQFPADGKELLEIFLSLPREYRVQVLEYARYFGERSAQAQKCKA